MWLPMTNWLLPSASSRIRSKTPSAADLQHTLKGFQGGNQEWGALCSRRHWQEQVFRQMFSRDFVSLVLAYHVLKSNKIINGDICSSWLAASFCKNVFLIACTLLHQTDIYTDLPPLPLQSSFSEISEIPSLGYSPLKTLTLFFFFFSFEMACVTSQIEFFNTSGLNDEVVVNQTITHLFGGQNSIKTGLIPPSQVSLQYQSLFTWLFLEILGISRYILMPEDAEKNNVLVNLLPSPNPVCPPQDRPIIGIQGIEARNNDFIQKAGYPRKCQNNVPEYHLIRIWMPVSFIEQRRGKSDEVK